MGNASCALCKTSLVSSCIIISTSSHAKRRGKVVKVVKTDGQAMTFTSPILVKDVMERLSGRGDGGGSGIGLSKEANSEHLPSDCELKIGKVYYVLQSKDEDYSSSGGEGEGDGIKRIKIVITKQQLKELLAKKISVDDVLSGMEKKTSLCNTTASVDHHHHSEENWKPKLESIPEGVE
ncbi:hypothetical protein L484_002574 [Morus notabilis]|uniref:DUF4228 domain-containing protein n=1 Tax=Morus notabilis TaxID=981085 RepID=W9R9C1_9ROSA|nr:uncharacterized protein LOC21386142 [Morus notabilis]EXB43106.1 hypothetical protein L484_002574 [Morus notabilis]